MTKNKNTEKGKFKSLISLSLSLICSPLFQTRCPITYTSAILFLFPLFQISSFFLSIHITYLASPTPQNPRKYIPTYLGTHREQKIIRNRGKKKKIIITYIIIYIFLPFLLLSQSVLIHIEIFISTPLPTCTQTLTISPPPSPRFPIQISLPNTLAKASSVQSPLISNPLVIDDDDFSYYHHHQNFLLQHLLSPQ